MPQSGAERSKRRRQLSFASRTEGAQGSVSPGRLSRLGSAVDLYERGIALVADTRGHLLPVYIMVDESGSMAPHIKELEAGLVSLHETLRSEPMIAAKVRLSVLGFSDDVIVRLELADLRVTEALPRIKSRAGTNYGAAFLDLLHRIPNDIATLKAEGYLVHRPAVFFLSDGQPGDLTWHDIYNKLTDKTSNATAPNVIAFGIGSVQARTILQVATQQDFAFVTTTGVDVGTSIAKFFVALTASVVQSGRSLSSVNPQLVVERPEGFHLAIDVI
jgi:uncharacterized protein YegL